MSNLENYMKQQAIFCEQNDSISKNLYLMIQNQKIWCQWRYCNHSGRKDRILLCGQRSTGKVQWLSGTKSWGQLPDFEWGWLSDRRPNRYMESHWRKECAGAKICAACLWTDKKAKAGYYSSWQRSFGGADDLRIWQFGYVGKKFLPVTAAASSNANTNVSMMGETFKYCAPIAGVLGFSAENP